MLERCATPVLRAAVKARTLGESFDSRRRVASHCARKPARKRKKTDDGTSEQSSPVRLPATVVPRCDGAMPGQQP